jgi:hypothetical protein
MPALRHVILQSSRHLEASRRRSAPTEPLLRLAARLYDRPMEPEPLSDYQSDSVCRTAGSTWDLLTERWGYPTIVGVHDDLYRCARELMSLASGIEMTLPYVSRDLSSVANEFMNSAASDETMIHLNHAYTMQIVNLVRSASSLVEQAAEFALDRFGT